MENSNLPRNAFIARIRNKKKQEDHLHDGILETDEDGNLLTSGFIGEHKYENFIDLLKGLWGFDIHVDDFTF